MWISAIRAPHEAEISRVAAEERFKINEAHNAVLEELERIDNDYVKEFVSDWRSYYSSASSVSYETLSELRQIKANILDDPEVAVKYTLKHKRDSARGIDEVVTPLFGGSFADSVSPGL